MGRLERVTLTHKEIFERYVYAGAITRNPDAIAEMFTEDGIFEAPLVPDGHSLPRRLVSRDAIRAGIGAYHQEPAYHGTVNVEESTYVLHDTVEPDVFVAEIDTVLDGTDGSVRRCHSCRSSASATGRSPCFATTSRFRHPWPPTTPKTDLIDPNQRPTPGHRQRSLFRSTERSSA